MKTYSTERFRPREVTVNEEPSMTVQSDVVRTEIKHIMAKYRQVGIIEHMRDVDLQFRDVTEFQDFADLMYQNKQAEAVFMKLPSKVREVFDHDYARWLDAAADPNIIEQLRPQLEKVGVLEPLPQAERRAPVVKPLGQRRAEDGRFMTDVPPRGGKE